MKPLLAHVYEPHRVTFPCYVQPKLNGIRALFQGGRFQSRDQQPFPELLLQHLSKPLLEIFDSNTILDGELYVHSWPLQRINAAVTPVRQEPTEDTVKMEYHIYDTVDYNYSFVERFKPIYDKLSGYQMTPAVETVEATSEDYADTYYASKVAQGYEGIMYRLMGCPYTVPLQTKNLIHWHVNPRARTLSDQDNRVWHLLKRKDFQDDEFLITGFNATTGPKGERGFQLHLITPSGKRFASGGGLTHSEVDHYLSNDPAGRMAKIKYLVLSSDGIPTGNPTILAIL